MNREAELLFHELADLSPAQREHCFWERHVPPELRTEVEQLTRRRRPHSAATVGWALHSGTSMWKSRLSHCQMTYDVQSRKPRGERQSEQAFRLRGPALQAPTKPPGRFKSPSRSSDLVLSFVEH